jgi:hypothetical protein
MGYFISGLPCTKEVEMPRFYFNVFDGDRE